MESLKLSTLILVFMNVFLILIVVLIIAGYFDNMLVMKAEKNKEEINIIKKYPPSVNKLKMFAPITYRKLFIDPYIPNDSLNEFEVDKRPIPTSGIDVTSHRTKEQYNNTY